jgi:uncharacterized protein involved in type VI secretion and phage assembly
MPIDIEPVAPQISLNIGGSSAPADLIDKISEVEVENNLHLPDMFTIRIHLRATGEKSFDVVDNLMKDYLSQDKEVEIGHQSGSRTQVFMVGEITSVSLELSATIPGSPVMAVIQGYDKSHRLHRGHHTRTFVNMSYSDIVTKVARESGLRAKVESTSDVFDYVIQANQSNWDFLWQLANRTGYEMFMDGGVLCFKKPWKGKETMVDLAWGSSLVQFRARTSTAFQTSDITVRGWDSIKKESIVGKSTKGKGAPDLGDTRSGAAQAESAFGASNLVLVEQPVRTQAEADAMAQSLADAIASGFVIAEGSTNPGMAGVLPGVTVRITGMGKRMSGDYFVTASTHHMSAEEGYTTSFVVGGRRSLTLSESVDSGGKSRELAYGGGVVVGLVTDNNDPDDLSRVKLQFPWLDDSVESDWARIAAPGAGKERGLHWLPEVNDEVLVAFEHGDMHRPYVLGGLWSQPDPPPASNKDSVDSGGAVQLRGLRSREGFILEVSDKPGSQYISIANPDHDSRVKIDHDHKVLEVVSNGDIIIKGPKGKIIVEAGQDVEIKAGGNLKIEASANIDIIASANLTMKGGLQTSVEAGANMSISGVQTSVEGSAMAELKGGLVRIN